MGANGSEFESEADLPLSVRNIRALRRYLPKRAVTYVVVGTIELRSVEGVEVIHRENSLEPFSNVEVLLGIQVFLKDWCVSHSPIGPLGSADDVLRWGQGECGGVIHLCDTDLFSKVVAHPAVGSGAQTDRAFPIRAFEAVGEGRAVLTGPIHRSGLVVQDPADLPSAGEVA